jgi:cytochrome c oxidase cbb3-type subunit 2
MSTHAVAFRNELCLMALLAMSLAGDSPCSAQQVDSVSQQNSKWNYTVIAKVPDKAKSKQNPLTADPDALSAGGKLFEEHCSECHGMKAEGGKRGPSLLRPEVQDATPGALFWILSNGVIRHGMPDWSKLPPEQRWQIVAFLKSFKAPAPH